MHCALDAKTVGWLLRHR